jgi:hypothetical protein
VKEHISNSKAQIQLLLTMGFSFLDIMKHGKHKEEEIEALLAWMKDPEHACRAMDVAQTRMGIPVTTHVDRCLETNADTCSAPTTARIPGATGHSMSAQTIADTLTSTNARTRPGVLSYGVMSPVLMGTGAARVPGVYTTHTIQRVTQLLCRYAGAVCDSSVRVTVVILG